MVVSVAQLLAEKNSVISFSDTVSFILEDNDFLNFHDVVQFIYRNFNLVSDDVSNCLASCSYDRVKGVSESDEIAAESLETLEYLISSNWISSIDNEGQGGYFSIYNNEGYENGSRKDFFFRKNELIQVLTIAGITFRFNEQLDNENSTESSVQEYAKRIKILSDENKKLKNEADELRHDKPKYLGVFRDDDPLLIAINIRNVEWELFDENNARVTTPSADYVIEKLKEQYGMSHALASAIERVACPIVRKAS